MLDIAQNAALHERLADNVAKRNALKEGMPNAGFAPKLRMPVRHAPGTDGAAPPMPVRHALLVLKICSENARLEVERGLVLKQLRKMYNGKKPWPSLKPSLRQWAETSKLVGHQDFCMVLAHLTPNDRPQDVL